MNVGRSKKSVCVCVFFLYYFTTFREMYANYLLIKVSGPKNQNEC